MFDAIFDTFSYPDALDAVLASEGVPALLAKLVADRLETLTASHRELSMEEMEEDEDLALAAVEMEIGKLLAELGLAIEARFGGDIRGSTVRLKLPSGRANGFMEGLWVIFVDE
jgi:hypothetical protein